MKTVLPWLLAIAALAGAFYFFSAGQKKSSDLASLRAAVADSEQVRDENESLKKLKAQANETARLKKENAGASKLREEIQQLQEDKHGLANQIQMAQEAVESARAKIISIGNAARAAQPAPVVDPASREEINSMRQVGLAAIMFAQDHNDSFPTNFAATAEQYLRLAPSELKILEQFEFLSMPEKLSEIQNTATNVVARGKFADANGRRSYLFADGHVEVRKDQK